MSDIFEVMTKRVMKKYGIKEEKKRLDPVVTYTPTEPLIETMPIEVVNSDLDMQPLLDAPIEPAMVEEKPKLKRRV